MRLPVTLSVGRSCEQPPAPAASPAEGTLEGMADSRPLEGYCRRRRTWHWPARRRGPPVCRKALSASLDLSINYEIKDQLADCAWQHSTSASSAGLGWARLSVADRAARIAARPDQDICFNREFTRRRLSRSNVRQPFQLYRFWPPAWTGTSYREGRYPHHFLKLSPPFRGTHRLAGGGSSCAGIHW